MLQKQRSPRYAGFFLGCLGLGAGLRFAFVGLCGSGGVLSMRRNTSSSRFRIVIFSITVLLDMQECDVLIVGPVPNRQRRQYPSSCVNTMNICARNYRVSVRNTGNNEIKTWPNIVPNALGLAEFLK